MFMSEERLKMGKVKNRARLFYHGKSFYLWQDEHENWIYNFENLSNINTNSKELQPALNIIHETIQERLPKRSKKC